MCYIFSVNIICIEFFRNVNSYYKVEVFARIFMEENNIKNIFKIWN